jgi:hypothetical protein
MMLSAITVSDQTGFWVLPSYDVGAPTLAAWMAAEPYREDDTPPKRLLVRRDGQVVVHER